jgi:CIC family chloride channel protein
MNLIRAVQIGALSAFIALAPSLIRSRLALDWNAPVFILGVAVLAMLVRRYILDRRVARGYDGVADLMIHVHSPTETDPPALWGFRGVLSFLLALFGNLVGSEGSAIELMHAFALRTRARSARWFEQRRRTDAAVTLAAGISAAFGAPFAAVLVPIELGLGGRAIAVVLASLIAFLVTRTLALWIPGSNAFIDSMDKVAQISQGTQLETWKQWAAVLAITVAGGCLGVFVIRFIRYTRESLQDLFQTRAWMRTIVGGVLLFLVLLVYKGGDVYVFDQLGLGRRSPSESGLVLCLLILQLSLVLSTFGSAGVFAPLIALGGFLGAIIDQTAFGSTTGFGTFAIFSGSAALWGAVLGAPLAGAILAFELTRNLNYLLPCLIAGFGARQIALRLGTPSLLALDLAGRGLELIEGRSSQILGELSVRDAMATDHEAVHEQEPISELHARLARARYPFFPVVNSQGGYVGLLTADMVQEAWRAQSKLLEAKDILYRQGFKTPVARSSDRLSSTAGYFDDLPCVPVLGEDKRVIGLLFVYSVRMVYDREAGRRSHLPMA